MVDEAMTNEPVVNDAANAPPSPPGPENMKPDDPSTDPPFPVSFDAIVTSLIVTVTP
jgi:hypothetical protein